MSSSQYVELGQNCYVVEAIRDRKIVKGKKLYFIKWKGWQQSTNTWEPLENLFTCMDMVQAYDQECQNKKGGIAKVDKQQASKKTKLIQKDKSKQKEKIKKKQFMQSQQESESEEQKLKNKKVKQFKVEQNIKKDQKNKIQESLTPKKNPTPLHSLKAAAKNDLSLQQKATTLQSEFQYTRINYYTIVRQNNIPKIYYNVNIRSRKTKRLMPVRDISSQVLAKQNLELIIKFLEGYIIQRQQYQQAQKEYNQNNNQ